MIDHPLVAEQQMTTIGCPEQHEGQLVDGQHFYFRYRSGRASLGLGETVEAAVEDLGEVAVPFGDSLQGAFDNADDRNLIFATLLARREEA